ncbi:MAG: hypothetical protein HC945_02140, partial [Nitrosarchaeum sp.]|nr:hypothetical protein [Nitrosarchaeum sp.]
MHDQKIQRFNSLAEVLKNYGFTSSASEAKRMAENIISTERRAQEDFQKKASSNTMYSYRRGQAPEQ